jgi:hypothetical protein
MSELALEKTVCAWLAFQGYIPLKVGWEGYPDRCVILGLGRHVWIEFKTEDGKLRPQQVNRIQKLHEIGEEVFIVTSLEDCQKEFAAAHFPSPLSTYSSGKDCQPKAAVRVPEARSWEDGYHPNRPKGTK